MATPVYLDIATSACDRNWEAISLTSLTNVGNTQI